MHVNFYVLRYAEKKSGSKKASSLPGESHSTPTSLNSATEFRKHYSSREKLTIQIVPQLHQPVLCPADMPESQERYIPQPNHITLVIFNTERLKQFFSLLHDSRYRYILQM